MNPPRPERLRVGAPAVLAFGSNLGDRAATIREALRMLGDDAGLRIEGVSRLYETPALKPDGISDEAPAYLNAVARVHTILDPLALLAAVNRVEDALGRVREERWGDRTIDIDIVDYDGIVSDDDPRIVLPHPRAHERAFVLVPWLDVDPDAVLPGYGPVAALAAAATDPVVPCGDVDGGVARGGDANGGDAHGGDGHDVGPHGGDSHGDDEGIRE